MEKRFREGRFDIVPNVEMRGRALLRSVSVKLAEIGPLRPAPAHSRMSLRDGIDVPLCGGVRRAVGLGEEWVFIEGLYDNVPNVEMRRVALQMS